MENLTTTIDPNMETSNYLEVLKNLKKLESSDLDEFALYLSIWESIGPVVDFLCDNIDLVNSDPQLADIVRNYRFANPQVIAEYANNYYDAGILNYLRAYNFSKRIAEMELDLEMELKCSIVNIYKMVFAFYIKLLCKAQIFFDICASDNHIPFELKYNIETFFHLRNASNSNDLNELLSIGLLKSFGIDWCTKIDDAAKSGIIMDPFGIIMDPYYI